MAAIDVRPPGPAAVTKPKGLHLGLFGNLQRVVDLNSEVNQMCSCTFVILKGCHQHGMCHGQPLRPSPTAATAATSAQPAGVFLKRRRWLPLDSKWRISSAIS